RVPLLHGHRDRAARGRKLPAAQGAAEPGAQARLQRRFRARLRSRWRSFSERPAVFRSEVGTRQEIYPPVEDAGGRPGVGPAQSLGVTQPAVSAQIKRLQALLGSDLLDKSAPGVSLTARGEAVVDCARRLLEINDRILHLAFPRAAEPPLRIGVPGDFAGAIL